MARENPISALKGLWKQLLSFALLSAIVFGGLALLEHRFVVDQRATSESRDLQDTLNDVAGIVFSKGHWNLNEYRQWDNSTEPSDYIILTATGELVDITGTDSDLLRTTLPTVKYIAQRPSLMQTDVGESWLVENKKVRGGDVVVGIVRADEIGLIKPERLLSEEISKFGGTIDSAASLDTTLLRNFLTGAAAIDNSGAIRNFNGSLPLRVEFTLPAQVLDGAEHNVQYKGETYALRSRRLATDSPAAVILAFDDISMDELNQNLRFNLRVALGAWIIALLCFTIYSVRLKQRKMREDDSLEISTKQLIAQGENAPVEFKETFRYNVKARMDDPQMKFMVLRAIASFLNTEGGTLLIGVDDRGSITGLKPDHFTSRDEFLLNLSTAIKEKLTDGRTLLANNIAMRIETMDDDLEVLRVDCKAALKAVFVKDKNSEFFFIRTGPSTQQLSMSEAVIYMKAHFKT